MSGTIVFNDHREWSASSGIFNWVLGFLIDQVEEGAIRDELSLIDEQNFRWLDLAQLVDYEREAVLRALRNALVPYSEENFPDTSHRQAALNVIRELSELAIARSDFEE